MCVRINCFDILIYSSLAYASSDLISNWNNYKVCQYPMNYWLLISYFVTLSIRILNYIGYCLSTNSKSYEIQDLSNIQDHMKTSFNWKNAKLLRIISYFSVVVLFPFFVVWTLIGTYWFSASFQETPYCFSNYQEYSFILFWLIIKVLWIVYAIMLITTYFVTESKTKALQKTIVSLLRKVDLNDNELIENSRANIVAENAKRNDIIQILNEYGIYFMNYGLTENEITKFKTRSFQGTENGNTRCVICINDFVLGERVRIYPGCDHIFHLKCSQLWLEIEGICPVCSNTPKDLSSSSLNNSLNPMNDQMVLIMDILNANNHNHQNIQQVAINNGDAEFNRRQNENFDDDNNNLREPLLRNINP